MDAHASTRLYYSTQEPVPLKDVIHSLQALERLAQRSPAILEELIPGLRVKRIQAFPVQIAEGSLIEEVAFKLITEYQEKLEGQLEEAGDLLGIDMLQTDSGLVSWIILALIAIGGVAAYRRIFPTQPTIHIEGDNNTVFNIGRDITGIDAEQLRQIVEGKAGNRHKLATDTVHILRPARGDRSATLAIDAHELSAGYINEVPPAIPRAEDDEVEEFEDVRGSIRATDRDSGKNGWGAIVPVVSAKRIKMHIGPGIDLEALARSRSFRGHISVIRRRQKDDSMRPSLILLHQVHEIE